MQYITNDFDKIYKLLTTDMQRQFPNFGYELLNLKRFERDEQGRTRVVYERATVGFLNKVAEIAGNLLYQSHPRNPDNVRVIGEGLEARIFHDDDQHQFPDLIIRSSDLIERGIVNYVHDGDRFYELA